MTTATFTALCRTPFSTRRGGAMDLATGKSGTATTPITAGKCTRIIPPRNVDELKTLIGMQTFYEMYETHTFGGQDIVNQDALISGGVEYAIRLVQPYPFGATETRLRLVLEKAKR